ncbi:MAG: methyltransferase domain-containing protein [Hyphomicrobiaceae bacterium]
MELGRRGAAAIAAGDLQGAGRAFAAAVKADGNSAEHRFNLAIVLEALGNASGAAEELTKTLQNDPQMTAASRRLCWLLGKGKLPDGVRLNRQGLKAALAHDTADRDLLAAATLHHLSQTQPLRRILERGAHRGWRDAALDVCLGNDQEILGDSLFLETLRRGVVSTPVIEKFLTAVRAALLLDVPPARFEDARLVRMAVALMQQCWLNEFVWAETPEEVQALDVQGVAFEHVLDGDSAAANAFMMRSMYRSPADVLGPLQPDALGKIEPEVLRAALVVRLAEERDIVERAAHIPRLGTILDPTSVKVATQYNVSPYPRWTSVLTYREGHYLKNLATIFDENELVFQQGPFEVLIAGCGTGRQAVSAALDYGSKARVTGLDITETSLGYASMMAERMGANNLSLAQGDIQDIGAFEPSFRQRFKVVECVGVLHHMASPFDGWRALKECLAPGGIMLIGLYSALARRNLVALKGDPSYPGADCSDAALRDYRQRLQMLPDGAPGSELLKSLDFYSASGFRDYVAHVSEQCVTLPQIADFLQENGLRFRGFFDVPFSMLQRSYPNAVRPGSLDQWAAYEADQPSLFSSMYQFWCTAEP